MTAYVQSAGKESSSTESSDSLAFVSDNQAGSLYVVFITWKDAVNGSLQNVNVADGNSNAISRIGSTIASGSGTETWRFSIWWAKNINAGPNTITFTWAGNVVTPVMLLVEYSGVGGSGVSRDLASVVGFGSDSSGGPYSISQTFTPSQANELAVNCVMANIACETFGEDSNYVRRFTDGVVCIQDRVTCPTGSQSASSSSLNTSSGDPPYSQGAAATLLFKVPTSTFSLVSEADATASPVATPTVLAKFTSQANVTASATAALTFRRSLISEADAVFSADAHLSNPPFGRRVYTRQHFYLRQTPAGVTICRINELGEETALVWPITLDEARELAPEFLEICR
jgi:hypothetical protein